jgi:hypothetical protein
VGGAAHSGDRQPDLAPAECCTDRAGRWRSLRAVHPRRAAAGVAGGADSARGGAAKDVRGAQARGRDGVLWLCRKLFLVLVEVHLFEWLTQLIVARYDSDARAHGLRSLICRVDATCKADLI